MSLDTTLRAYATVSGATAMFTTPEGLIEPLAATPTDDIRQMIVRRAASEAQRTGVAVELVTTGDRGEHHLRINPDGTIATGFPTTGDGPPRSHRVAVSYTYSGHQWSFRFEQ